MSDLVTGSVLGSAQVEQQLVLRDVTDIVVGKEMAGGVAVGASGHEVLNDSTRGEGGREVEVDRGCGLGSDEGVIREGICGGSAWLVRTDIEKRGRREDD
jgi:hypothetical protein